MNGTIYSTIIGTICADPKPFYKVQGDEEPAGCTIRLAVNRQEREGNQWKSIAQFIDISALGYQAKRLMKAAWCRKGYHAYFVCKQTEREYTRKDHTIVRVPVYTYLDGDPILTADSYKNQQASEKRQAAQENAAAQHAAVGAQNSPQQPLPAHNENLENDDIPF